MQSATNNLLGCALIGPGNFGRGLARALVEDERVRFVGVLGASVAESQAGANELGGRAFASLEELQGAADVAAVLIATPSHTHADLAVAMAQAGKHVFVEKPMALSVTECDAMIAAADAAGVALMVGQVQRFFPLLADVRTIIQQGTIGQPVTTLMYRHDLLQRTPGSWLQRRVQVGGLLHQSCVHEIDWLRTLHGEVAKVFARAGSMPIQTGLDFPDAAEISLEFASGGTATLSACMTSYVNEHGGVIHGTHGTLRFDLLAGMLRWRTAAGEEVSRQRESYTVQAGHRHATRVELQGFVDAALGLAAVPVPGCEGRANVAVVEAALASIDQKREIIL